MYLFISEHKRYILFFLGGGGGGGGGSKKEAVSILNSSVLDNKDIL